MYAILNSNDMIGLAGFVVGLVGLAATVWTSWTTKVGARLSYRWKAERVIGGDGELGEGIEVAFKGTPVIRLTRAVIVVWNSGTATIRDSDIVQLDPVRVQCEEYAEILSARVLQSSRQIVGAEIRVDPAKQNRALLAFDFFDPGDGVVIEVLHTGDERKPSFCGTLRGMPKGIKNWCTWCTWGQPDLRF